MVDLLRDAPFEKVPIADARLLAANHVVSTGQLRGLSAERFLALWERFERFAERRDGIVNVDEITAAAAAAFIDARASGGKQPSVATKHLRRSALRLLFRTLREFGLMSGDPTLDLALPRREARPSRPLTDPEVDRGRWGALATTVATRHPAAWALAEAGAWPSELANVRVADLDLDRSIVRLPGGPKVSPRSVPLTPWGVSQLARRVRQPLRGEVLVCEGSGSDQSRRTSATEAVRQSLARAGLLGDVGVSVTSVVAWAGVRANREGGIEEAACRLGLASLDQAAALIGYEWRSGRG